MRGMAWKKLWTRSAVGRFDAVHPSGRDDDRIRPVRRAELDPPELELGICGSLVEGLDGLAPDQPVDVQ
jgi:hypothetical protein